MRSFLAVVCFTLLLTTVSISSASENGGGEQPLQIVTEPIVNGVLTSAFPEVGALLFSDGICTGTLIGCRTVLTAAHCVCGEGTPGAICQPRTDLVVFFQHGGIHAIDSVAVNPNYQFGVRSDLAIVKLASQVNGLRPTLFNVSAQLPFGTEGVIAGFGRIGGQNQLIGIKRFGSVRTSSCVGVAPDSTHLCWEYGGQPGPPGANSSICQGDSGGPMFAEIGAGPKLAGVASGFVSPGQPCLVPSLAVEADVSIDSTWIQAVGGSDLSNNSCGSLPPAGGPNAPILFANGTLSPSNPDDVYMAEVPAGTELLRLALNGESSGDFNLYAKAGSPPTTSDFDCSSSLPGLTFDSCEVALPSPGAWYFLADRAAGNGAYQLTATAFLGSNGGGPCVEDGESLCLLNDRFRVRVSFRAPGQISQAATAIPFTDRAGMFWFFNQNNIEMLVKMQNACVNPFNHYWLFFAATTNVEFEVTVEDTQAHITRTYSNPQGRAALPVQDTEAFATCP